MGDRVNNMNKMLQNPKQRNMYLLLIFLAFLALATGFWFVTRTAKNNKAPAGASVANVPSIQAAPGTSTSVEYNKKVEEANKKGANSALDGDKSFVPTPTNNTKFSDKSPLDLLEKEAQAKKEAEKIVAEKVIEETPVPVIVAPPAVIIPVVQTPVVIAPPAPPAKKYGSNEDYMLLGSLIGSWKVKAPSSEFDYSRVKDDKNKDVNVASQANAQNTTTSAASATPLPFAKAGSIFNAILETGINSDEPSPILAKVISGDLKGARLIGQVNRVGEKVVVQFSTISLPTSPSSVKINAVAVDANTSRTALVSDVDNHYFKKYGVMFAAAFLGGYANAIARQNTTTIVDPLGGATIVQGQLSAKDINKQALGNVGKEIAESTRAETQNIKPTVTVNQGIAIGVLLMDDLIIR